MACDDSYNPRYYQAIIKIKDALISNVIVDNVVRIKDTSKLLDLESIRYDIKTNRIHVTTEGNVYKKKKPYFFSVNAKGEIEKLFKIPTYFYENMVQRPTHNGGLEGLCKSYDGGGYWISMELPLAIDGPEPQLTKTISPVRITYIDTKIDKAIKQFAYLLDPIAKKPKNDFSNNGLTELLEYEKDKFFVIERSYSSGLGNMSNTIKIFNVDASKATNTLEIDSLNNIDYITATKKLLLNFDSIRTMLTDNNIDNIEGITFGPILPNGNKSLLLVSDNNFNVYGKQLNQFILLEIVD